MFGDLRGAGAKIKILLPIEVLLPYTHRIYLPSLIHVGPAVSEVWGFENVDTVRTDGHLTGFTCILVISGEMTKTRLNPLESRGNYSTTSNNMKLVHWPLMGRLLHLVQRGGRPVLLGVPNVISPPINGQCTNHRIAVYNGPLLCGFNVPIKG